MMMNKMKMVMILTMIMTTMILQIAIKIVNIKM
jgi:hypothetical protein